MNTFVSPVINGLTELRFAINPVQSCFGEFSSKRFTNQVIM
jgi:hypothetical protein